ncbi:MAG: AraC family transcriptional regulator [Verrucomicrobiales bacterium]|jgi:AraC-like DNA-binding protein|nr:AraC family transcriptional regulator [Verrucomicrobiales bacterium]
MPAPVPLTERPLWNQVIGTWRQLHGRIADTGASIEWHDFRLAADFDWARTFHPDCLEICLNYTGAADFALPGQKFTLAENQLAWYLPGRQPLTATRRAATIHRFFTLEISRRYLARQFAATINHLQTPVRAFLDPDRPFDSHVHTAPLTSHLLVLRQILLAPPVPPAAQPWWYQGKILEIITHTLFAAPPPDEIFTQGHNRQKQERVERARYLLERDMENPPSLGDLAREAGCSPYHLSRLFAEATGVSIPKYLRMKRIEKAAALILSGKQNVTHAAFAVGYSSLSAFTKAFVEQIGVCPGLYGITKCRQCFIRPPHPRRPAKPGS